MAISRFSTSSVAQGLPKYQKFWDQSSVPQPTLPVTTNLKLWLNATYSPSVISSGGKVSQWSDLSGNGYHFTQATSTNQPSVATGINSKQTLSFNGSTTGVSNTTRSNWTFMNDGTGCTIFIVARYNNFTSSPGLMGTSNGTADVGIAFFTSNTSPYNQYVAVGRGVSSQWTSVANNSGMSPNSNFYLTVKSDPANGTASNRIKIAVNNGADEGSNTNTYSYSSSTPTRDFFIGNDAGGQYLDGHIGEVIIYSGILGSTDIATMKSYLATKWGI
jgi:hypothetical protein